VRTVFHQQLDDLTVAIAEMCGSAGEAMEYATRALLRADLVLAEQVITDHDDIVARARKTEEQALTVLALQAPVAAVKNLADVDRMGALALHIAKLTRRRHPDEVLPEEVKGYFTEMGRIAVDMGRTVKDVVLSKDAHRAEQLGDDDDDMDHLHRHLFSVLMDREWKHGVAAAVDVTLLGRYYERFADHAVEIGRRVVFQTTGESV
jgi:phosphate transport system protein